MPEAGDDSERTISVFVGNLSNRIEPGDIRKWFSRELLDVKIIDMKVGFAFVHILDDINRNIPDINESSSSDSKFNMENGDDDNELNDDDKRRETSQSTYRSENLSKTVKEILSSMYRTVLLDGDSPVTVELAKGDRKVIEERRKITLPTRVLFVVGFDPTKVTTNQIRTIFDVCGEVICVKKIDNYCFITFNEQVDAENAFQKFNGAEVLGRTLTVEYGKSAMVATERGDLEITKAQRRFENRTERRSNDRGGGDRGEGRPRNGGYPRERMRSRSRSRNYRSRSRDRFRRLDHDGPSRYENDSRYPPMPRDPRDSRDSGAHGGRQAYIVYARNEADIPPNAVRLPVADSRYTAPLDNRYGPRGGGGGRSRSRSPPRSAPLDNRYGPRGGGGGGGGRSRSRSPQRSYRHDDHRYR